jgi:asparagine synthase (glutamine-hydrolysing)
MTAESIESTGTQLREMLGRTCAAAGADCMLFSGGVDTSVLAALVPKAGIKTALTVTFDTQGEDLKYAERLAVHLGLPHVHLPVTLEAAMAAIPDVIKVLASFDPALPNDLVVYIGMRRLKEQGLTTVITGDGADEVLAGYDFMQEMADVEDYIRRIEPRMVFSSNVIAEHFGLRLVQPFLDPAFVEFALSIPVALKIRRDNGTLWGKWILRKAFEQMLPYESAWQSKRPLEYGSGMHSLRRLIEAQVTDDAFNNHSNGVQLMNKEHLYYYRVYRQVIGPVPGPAPGQTACRACGAGMPAGAFHCRVCGDVLDWRTP